MVTDREKDIMRLEAEKIRDETFQEWLKNWLGDRAESIPQEETQPTQQAGY